jgi:transcription elongation factor SPT6
MSNDLARLIDAEAELDDEEDDESFDEAEDGEQPRRSRTAHIDDSSEEEEDDDEEEARKVGRPYIFLLRTRARARLTCSLRSARASS